jgi:DNA-binding NtrC family response regulator
MDVIVALHDERVIEPWHLSGHIAVPVAEDQNPPFLDGGSFEQEVRAFKRRLIERKLFEHHNNKLQAAKSLGLARSSLHRLIDELHIDSVRLRHPSKQHHVRFDS